MSLAASRFLIGVLNVKAPQECDERIPFRYVQIQLSGEGFGDFGSENQLSIYPGSIADDRAQAGAEIDVVACGGVRIEIHQIEGERDDRIRSAEVGRDDRIDIEP